MNTVARFLLKTRYRLAALFGLSRKNDDLSEELEQHIEMAIADGETRGLSSEEARKEALREFGSIEVLKEECRDSWGTRVVMDLIRDFRFTIQSLRRTPVFTVTVVGVIALCIAANTTVLSALHQLILRPLPFKDPERLVQVINVGIYGLRRESGDGMKKGMTPSNASWVQYLDWSENTTLFEGFGFRTTTTRVVERDGVVAHVPVHAINAGLFDLMGVTPLLGRFFTEQEVEPGPGPGNVIILTQSTWENEFRSDPSVVGKQVRLDNKESYTIVGVAPRSMEILDARCKYFLPISIRWNDETIQQRANGGGDLWARLKPGVSREAALSEIEALEAVWYQEVALPGWRNHYDKFSDYLTFSVTHPMQQSLSLLQGGALFVFLVGCLNVMTLLVGRVSHRCQELGIRRALGAGASALRRLMLVESFLLTLCSVVAGLGLSQVALGIVNAYLPIAEPSLMPVAIGKEIYGVIAAGAIAVFLFMGLAPLTLFGASGRLSSKVEGTRAASVGSSSRKLTHCLVVGQVAITFTLLIGAGLLLRSFHKVMQVDPGVPASQVLYGTVEWQTLRSFYVRKDTIQLKNRIADELNKIPGMQHVAISSSEPLRASHGSLWIKGFPGDDNLMRAWNAVSRNYFETMGMVFLEGRNFDPNAPPGRERIVDESFSELYLDGKSPLGLDTQGGTYNENGPWGRIVGVVSRANLQGLEQRDGVPFMYTHNKETSGSAWFTVIARTSRIDENVSLELQKSLREVDPRLPPVEFVTLKKTLDDLVVGRKGITYLLIVFAALALVLAIMGIYAVLSYDVLQRRKEMGIRSALGAAKGSLLGMVLKQGFIKTGLGLVIGIAGAIAISRILESQLFDVAPFDPLTYLLVAVGLLATGIAASYIPARFAANQDPAKVLASE